MGERGRGGRQRMDVAILVTVRTALSQDDNESALRGQRTSGNLASPESRPVGPHPF